MKKKTITLEEAKTKLFGKVGTPQRDAYDTKLKHFLKMAGKVKDEHKEESIEVLKQDRVNSKND